jgi:hypothetical protein
VNPMRTLDVRTLTTCIAQLPAFVAAHDPDGLLLWANRIGYGLDPKKIYGQPAADRILPEDRPRWSELFRRAVHQGETAAVDVRIAVPMAPGVIRMIGHLGPVITGGRVRYVVSVVRDAAPLDSHVLPFLLGTRERPVVDCLLRSPPLKSAALARKLNGGFRGQTSPSTLRAILSGLADRGVIENTPAGYRVTNAFRPLAEIACSET